MATGQMQPAFAQAFSNIEPAWSVAATAKAVFGNP